MWAGRSTPSCPKMSAPLGPTPSDVRKMGYLKKLKTNKKKLFLLREESDLGPARLEYYDSEKKYKAGGPAKRWIPLRACFNINKKSDAKHKYAIALYTKEDCFAVVCETEAEQEEWLTGLLDLHNDNISDSDEPRPFFEHIWQVTVKPRGLGNGKNLQAGPYRLCLTNKTLSLVRTNQPDPDIIFQLASLRRCGHSDCFFFMEAGSSAVTGAGELWMQVEDTVIARNIHETILRNMAGEQPFRPRSRSSVSDRRSTKPISVPGNSRGASPGYDSSTLPVRSKTISGDHPSSPTPPSRLRPGTKGSSSGRSSTTSSLGRGHSPVPTSPLGHTLSDAHRSRTDSMESRGSRGTVSSLSADELDLSPHDHHSHQSSAASTRSVTPEGGSNRDDPCYLSMTPMGSKDCLFDVTGRCNSPHPDLALPYILVSPTSDMGPTRDGYMEMGAMGSSRDSYMDMSPDKNQSEWFLVTMETDTSHLTGQAPAPSPFRGETTYLDMARTSFSSSPAVSTTSSGHDADEHCYLDMASIAHSLPTVQERITDAGYLDMSPGNTWCKGPLPRGPDRVHSYLSDDQSQHEDFPKRAYSVGSKPVKPRDTSSYVDMTGKHTTLDKVTPKSSSAPHLVDKEKAEGVVRHVKEPRTTPYNKDLFMEFDFLRKDAEISPFRPRTSSAGREFRQRTSSIGQEARRRTGSFGKEGVSRTGSMNRHDRPRTTTICQDSFRNRTSSFGSTDMRPRSSSHGSRGYYKGKVTGGEKDGSTDSRGSSRHSSQESLRRTLQKAAEEFNNKTPQQQESYMDMLMRRTPSPSVTRVSEKTGHKLLSARPQDEYLAMSTGGSGADGAGDSYMDMNYDADRHKDTRRRPSDTNSATKDPKAAKSRNRSSLKSQQHRLYLRMPSTESKSSNTAAESTEDAQTEVAMQCPGEYIDIAFAKPSSKGSMNQGRQNSYDQEDSKAAWSPPTEAYAIYSPSGVARLSSPSEVRLEPVVCPLRLDDEDDTPNASPNAVIPGPLSTTPTAGGSVGSGGDYMVVTRQRSRDVPPTPDTTTPVLTLDPFSLLTSPPQPKNDYMKIDTTKEVRTPSKNQVDSSSKSVAPFKDDCSLSGRNRIGSNSSTSSRSSRKSPVLPPKTRSRERSSVSSVSKANTTPMKVATMPISGSAAVVTTSVAGSDCRVSWSPSCEQVDCRDRVKHHSGPRTGQNRISASGADSPRVGPSDAGSTPPFTELVPPFDLGGQTDPCTRPQSDQHRVPKLSASTSSLSAIEPVMSSASAKVSMTSRGSTSSLTAMDTKTVVGGIHSLTATPCSDHLTSTPAPENLTGRTSHHSSRNSVGSDKELNYASLDLASSQDESTFPSGGVGPTVERSPRSPLIGMTAPTVAEEEGEEEEDNVPLSYAQIDFTRSEELRTATSLRERMPFDVK